MPTEQNAPATTKRTATIAFMAWMCVLTAQGLLQTARDSLFLATLPASSLPYVYVLVAVLTLIVSRVQRWTGKTGRVATVSLGCPRRR